ncbi:MAG: MFS transporter [Rhodothermia bacterium]|nr:MAG: MFS transporter [Rhodothermia bacterium]
MNHPQRSVDTAWSLGAAIWLGIIGSSVLLILPVFVGTLIEDRGLSNIAAGWIGSADLMGFALASIFAFRWVRKYSWRTIVMSGLAMIVVGDVSSIFLSNYWYLFSARLLLSGMGAGFVIAVPYTLLGDTRNPERNTGLYFTFNVLGGAAGLLLMPIIVAKAGASGLFLTLAVTASTAIPAAWLWLPGAGKNVDRTHVSGVGNKAVIAILIGIGLFNFGLGGVWAFVERIGIGAGISAAEVGPILSSTYLVGMLGSSAAAWQAARFGYLKPYSAGIGILSIALLLLLSKSGLILFVVALSLMNFAWNYSLTYQFSAVYSLDDSGRMSVLIILVQALGLMFGPGVAGIFVSASGFATSIFLGIAMCLLSLGFFLTAHRQSCDE